MRVDLFTDITALPDRHTSLGYVYAAKQGPLIKIGKSTDPRYRLENMQMVSALPFKVVLLTEPHFSYSQTEALAHEHFAALRRHGEWFAVRESRVRAFLENCAMVKIPEEWEASERALEKYCEPRGLQQFVDRLTGKEPKKEPPANWPYRPGWNPRTRRMEG